MVATTMHLTNLLQRLKNDYPSIAFESGDRFAWLPQSQTITYTPVGDPALLLHELGHALLSHGSYDRDIQLLAMERSAWDEAIRLAPTLEITVSDDSVEDHLDTYRDWLHDRSTCPSCTATGFQKNQQTYACPACSQEWTVNEARICQLRRTKSPLQ